MPRKGDRTPREPVGDVRDPDSLYHWLLRYLDHLAEKNYSPATIASRDTYLRYFIIWCDDRGLTRPQHIDRPILERYQKHLFYVRKKDGEPLSTRSQHVRITPIRHYLQWLTKQGLLLYNPAADLELPRLEKRLPKAILSAREAELVLGQTDTTTAFGLRDRAILETLYSTGMRRMEVIGLHLHDLDTERGTVMIRQGKGKKDRMIPIGDRALAWIARYRDTARPELIIGRDEGTLFLTHLGQAFTPNRLTQLVRDLIDRAHIGKRGSCHLFRHTMATLMLENGADIRVIQAMLGHAELSTTQIYTQVSIRLLKAIHTATHPGKLAKAGPHEEIEVSPLEELLNTLEREGKEEEDSHD